MTKHYYNDFILHMVENWGQWKR